MKKQLFACLFGAAILFGPRAAHADITFCNNSPNEIWVMYGQEGYVNDGLSCSQYDVVGWYAVSPNGGCTTAVSGCICNEWSNIFGDCALPFLYYYADDAHGTYWGGGNDWDFWTSNSGFHVCESGNAPPFECSNGCPSFGQYVNPDIYDYSNPTCGMTINFQ